MNLLSIFRPKENSIDVVKKFFFLSNVQATRSTKEKAPYCNPDFPYFLIISDILTFHKICNAVLRHLQKMPFPFIIPIVMHKDTLAKGKGACTL